MRTARVNGHFPMSGNRVLSGLLVEDNKSIHAKVEIELLV